MKTTSEVSAANAYKYADNYRIESADGLNFIGVEHNREEADAIARYLTNYHGTNYVVVKNRPDQVTAAKAIRGGVGPPRFREREMVLTDMGVWAKAKQRRGR